MQLPNNSIQATRVTDITTIPGLKELWAETLGDPLICIAVLDGPADQLHPSLIGAKLTSVKNLVSKGASEGAATQHGTHVTSVIFGQHDGPIKGIAPHCRGLVVPIFNNQSDHNLFAPCSQLDLARAITQAVQEGAHIINISAGEFTFSGTAHPLLANAVENCATHDVLIVAATGNGGCDCLHIPSALPSVLAVGAMDSRGLPLIFSNWGEQYQNQGILAPGENILGASPNGAISVNSGTSYAAPIVSGIAALLLSLQLKHGQKPDPHAIRLAILNSALGCNDQPVSDCRRLLAGRLNVKGAILQTLRRVDTMPNLNETQYNPQEQAQSHLSGDTSLAISSAQLPTIGTQATVSDSNSHKLLGVPVQAISMSTPESYRDSGLMSQNMANSSNLKTVTCGCDCGNGARTQLVFALGKLGYDFGTKACLSSIIRHMDPSANDPYDPKHLLAYLEKNPWDASAINWILILDETPIYAIQAQGAFASHVYQRLQEFLREQVDGEVERISIPGFLVGNVKLFTGEVVRIIWPDLRGMYSWNTKDLVEAICKEKDAYSQCKEDVANFLLRIYEDLRNLGISSQERAINYAATNALLAADVFVDAIKKEMELDDIAVERSPICRPESDCWDVKLTFFNPSRVSEQARRVYRLTIDVSGRVPVPVGGVRAWYLR